MAEKFIFPNWPAPKNVCACTTTRLGGVSKAPYDSLNLSTKVGDEPTAVRANRAHLKQMLNLPSEPFWLDQAHTNRAVIAESYPTYPVADASYTTKACIVCVVLTADCLPILLCSKKGDLIAAIHAGWKGIINGVIEATIKALPANPTELIAWFGPAIGPQAFIVGSEVRDQFINFDAQAQTAFTAIEPQKWLCNIYLIGQQRLNSCGVTGIYGGEFCTYSDAQMFFSFRRSEHTGRLASLIWRSS